MIDYKPDVTKASALAKFFFLRPIFGTLLAILVVVGGLFAYISLVKESMPDLDIPQATVVTMWPGADPQTVEQEVTEKLEKQIKSTKGVKSVNSASFDSYSMISVEFEANADSKEAAALLRTAVDDAAPELPREAEKPTINQVSVDDRPVMSFVVYGEVGAATLSVLAEDIQEQLERVAGVNEVLLGGARSEVVQILLDPNKILALGISPTKVRDAIQAANVDMPWGELENEKMGQTLRLTGKFRDLEGLKDLPIARLGGGANGGGRAVRLREIATVRRDLEAEVSRASYSWKGGEFESSIEVSVKKAPGSDTIAVIASVREELKTMQDSNAWPSGVSYRVTQDETETINTSLMNAFNNGWQAMLAVFIILFVLLTWREGLMAGLAIPLTFLGALIIIWALGYTLNELVIIGMVLALGLMVDVFILMMEGLHEGIFVEKLTFGQAALKTVKRYALPAAAGQATTILAMAPLMAIGGLAGKFIRVLPMTAIACLVTAFIIALLVNIPMARYLLSSVAKKGGEEKKTKADKITEKLSGKLERWTSQGPLKSKRSAWLWTGGAFGVFIISLFAVSQVSVIMYPKGDGRKLGVSIEMPPATSLETSQEVADRLGKILNEKPYFESIVKVVGKKSSFGGGGLASALQPSTGDYYIGFSCMFVEREDRDLDGYVIADDLRSELSKILHDNFAGAKIEVVGETGQPDASDPIAITLTGNDLDELRRVSNDVQNLIRSISGTADVRDNLGPVKPEITLTPNREAIDFYKIQSNDLAAQVRFAMDTSEIGQFMQPGIKEDIPIMMGMDWPSQNGKGGSPTSVEELSLIRAYTPQGETVALLSLLEPSNGEAPVSITHSEGRRALTVMAKAPNRPSADIMKELTPKLDEMKEKWASGYSYKIGGEAEATAETFGSAGVMLVVAIVMVFGVLVLTFGSFKQAFILILTIPLALIGTFIGFYLTDTDLSFFAMVGIIALIGIVANDAIVMVDTMNDHLRNGKGVHDAASHGASDRLRPILSTSITTIVGLIPLAISNPMWRPLCLAVIFGLIASTVLSLVIIPCLYSIFTHESHGEAESLD